MDHSKLALIGRIDSYEDRVIAAVLVPREEGVVAISQDRTIKVWMKRSTGQYWPSISHVLPATPSCMNYDLKVRRLLVGLESGAVLEFEISEDYNKLTKLGEYQAHRGAVKCIERVEDCALTCGGDSLLMIYSLSSHSICLTHWLTSPGFCLTYDTLASYVYIGDSGGLINVLKLTPAAGLLSGSPCSLDSIIALKRHTAGVSHILLDPAHKCLYSASLDHTVLCWNTGDLRSNPLTLTGHFAAVRGLSLIADQLITVGEDSHLIVWDMTFTRQPIADWRESDLCESCSTPFYWNIRAMWDTKTVGVRQHHCRRCGCALCSRCSPHTDICALMGYELPQRTCEECHRLNNDQPQASHVTRHPLHQSAVYVDMDAHSKSVLTVGRDHVVKIWNASGIV